MTNVNASFPLIFPTVPLITPVEPFSVNPEGSAFGSTDHVSPVVPPPEACNVVEYALPEKASGKLGSVVIINGVRTVSVTGTTTGEFVACDDVRVIAPLYIPGGRPAGLNVIESVSGAVQLSLAPPSIVIQAPPDCSVAMAVPIIGPPELFLTRRPIVPGAEPWLKTGANDGELTVSCPFGVDETLNAAITN
jgi:hypothetical protein